MKKPENSTKAMPRCGTMLAYAGLLPEGDITNLLAVVIGGVTFLEPIEAVEFYQEPRERKP